MRLIEENIKEVVKEYSSRMLIQTVVCFGVAFIFRDFGTIEFITQWLGSLWIANIITHFIMKGDYEGKAKRFLNIMLIINIILCIVTLTLSYNHYVG